MRKLQTNHNKAASGELIPPSSQPGKRGSHWSSEASMQRSQGGSGGGMNLGVERKSSAFLW